MSRSHLTAPLSHLRFLIPPLFDLFVLLLLFLHSLPFLLPSAAEAVQAAEAGAGERHRLPVAPHPRGPARGWEAKGVKMYSCAKEDLCSLVLTL